jgi:hypothetical protein
MSNIDRSNHQQSGPKTDIFEGADDQLPLELDGRRRRLIRAGLSAAPVILALSGRSALATGTSCGAKGLSPLAWSSLSPNGDGTCNVPSHTIQRNVLGKSPGLWMPNCGGNANVFQVNWPASVKPFSAYDASLLYKGIAADDARWATGTKFNAFIASYNGMFAGGIGSPSSSFSRILLDNPAAYIPAKICSAYLNALVFPNYSMTTAEVLYLAANGKLVAGGPALSDSAIRNFLDQTWS